MLSKTHLTRRFRDMSLRTANPLDRVKQRSKQSMTFCSGGLTSAQNPEDGYMLSTYPMNPCLTACFTD